MSSTQRIPTIGEIVSFVPKQMWGEVASRNGGAITLGTLISLFTPRDQMLFRQNPTVQERNFHWIVPKPLKPGGKAETVDDRVQVSKKRLDPATKV